MSESLEALASSFAVERPVTGGEAREDPPPPSGTDAAPAAAAAPPPPPGLTERGRDDSSGGASVAAAAALPRFFQFGAAAAAAPAPAPDDGPRAPPEAAAELAKACTALADLEARLADGGKLTAELTDALADAARAEAAAARAEADAEVEAARAEAAAWRAEAAARACEAAAEADAARAEVGGLLGAVLEAAGPWSDENTIASLLAGLTGGAGTDASKATDATVAEYAARLAALESAGRAAVAKDLAAAARGPGGRRLPDGGAALPKDGLAAFLDAAPFRRALVGKPRSYAERTPGFSWGGGAIVADPEPLTAAAVAGRLAAACDGAAGGALPGPRVAEFYALDARHRAIIERAGGLRAFAAAHPDALVFAPSPAGGSGGGGTLRRAPPSPSEGDVAEDIAAYVREWGRPYGACVSAPREFFKILVPLVASDSYPTVSSGPAGFKVPRSSPTPGERVFKNSFRNTHVEPYLESAGIPRRRGSENRVSVLATTLWRFLADRRRRAVVGESLEAFCRRSTLLEWHPRAELPGGGLVLAPRRGAGPEHGDFHVPSTNSLAAICFEESIHTSRI